MKQREIKFKPRIKYDPQQIYVTKMWDIMFSPESTVRPILALIPHQNNTAITERVSQRQRIKVTLHHFVLQKWD